MHSGESKSYPAMGNKQRPQNSYLSSSADKAEDKVARTKALFPISN